MMEKEIFFVIIHVLLKTILCEVRVYTDDDVYISNISIPYTDIPSDCHLFGADFGEDSTNNTVLNITTPTIFWIGATVRFKRNINPIGVIENCPENYEEDISLDECNLMCNDYKYFNFGEKSCTCKNDNMTDDTLFKTEPCEDGEKGLCSLEKCIVYQRVIEDEYYTCGTYKYISIYNSWIWILNFETCSEKKNYSYICDNGVLIHKPNKTWLNWREAYQICKDNGFNLINTTKGIQESEDSQTYWVSFFRKLKFYWGAHRTNDICVAGSIDENGTLTLVTKHCTESFPVLCHKINGMKDQRSNGASPSDVNIGMIVGICAAVVVLLAFGVIAVIVGCKRYKS